MQPIYHQIRQRARQIILRHPTPDFYHDHSPADEASRQFFDADRVIKKLLSLVAETLEDDFGHGLIHAVKVSHDAGTLMVIEARQSGYDEDPLSRLVCLVQTAGLLHDIKRKTKDHSSHAAAHAKKLLRKYPFSAEEIKNIPGHPPGPATVSNRFLRKPTCKPGNHIYVMYCLIEKVISA